MFFTFLELVIVECTDTEVGDDTDKHENKAFAQKRANAVKAVLIKNGVEANRIKIKIIGAAEPVANGDTEPDMVKNRRVEFFVVTD